MARRVDPERAAARRAEITAAAAELFAARGFDRTTRRRHRPGSQHQRRQRLLLLRRQAGDLPFDLRGRHPAAHEQVQRHAQNPSALAGILATVEELAAEARWPGAAGLMVELLRVVDRDEQLQEIVGSVAAVRVAGLAELVRRAAAAGEIAADLAGVRGPAARPPGSRPSSTRRSSPRSPAVIPSRTCAASSAATSYRRRRGSVNDRAEDDDRHHRPDPRRGAVGPRGARHGAGAVLGFLVAPLVRRLLATVDGAPARCGCWPPCPPGGRCW